ncbi:MAG: amidohydrolase family protein [Salinigranum sp.]
MANSKTVLKATQVIDGASDDPIDDGVVVVEGDEIADVGREGRVDVPANAEVVETDGTIMPGLMDIHMHLSSHNVTTFKNHRVALYETSPELQQLYALHHAKMMFDHGFTTIRDMPWVTNQGDDTARMMVAIRDAIANGIHQGPRLLVGGYAHITNSHFDVLLPRGSPRDPKIWDSGWTADGPDELRKMAREKMLRGVNFIKTVASGGGGTDLEPPNVRNMTQEELDAIVDEAHAFDKHCSCHCFTPEAQRAAVRAGVDTIEHCVFTDEEALDAMQEADVPVIPTFMHRTDHAIKVREQIGTSDYVLNKMREIQPYCWDTFRRLLDRDITIAMGTDTHYDPEMGTNVGEIEIYVDLGMDPMEALKTATKNAAEAIGMGDEIGTLEPGKSADLIVVDGDPLSDVAVLQDKANIEVVMKQGTVSVDRRPGHERYLFPNDEYRWDRIMGGGDAPADVDVDVSDLDLPRPRSENEGELDVEYEMAYDDD